MKSGSYNKNTITNEFDGCVSGLPWKMIIDRSGGSVKTYYLNLTTGISQDIKPTLWITGLCSNDSILDYGVNGQSNNLLISDNKTVRFTGPLLQTITGIDNGYDNRIVYFDNTSPENVVLKNESADSLSQNKIITGTGGDLILKPDQTVALKYDPISLAWRPVGGIGGGDTSTDVKTGIVKVDNTDPTKTILEVTRSNGATYTIDVSSLKDADGTLYQISRLDDVLTSPLVTEITKANFNTSTTLKHGDGALVQLKNGGIVGFSYDGTAWVEEFRDLPTNEVRIVELNSDKPAPDKVKSGTQIYVREIGPDNGLWIAEGIEGDMASNWILIN